MPQVTGNLDLADTKSDLDAGTNWVLGYKSVPNYWGESDSHNGGVDSFEVAFSLVMLSYSFLPLSLSLW